MKKIFLLDDNVELIELTEMVLGKEYIIKSVSTVDNLKEEISSFAPDLILIDHFIGDSNSENIMKDIHLSNPDFNTPLVLFSASHDIEAKAERLGAAGFIEKPSSIGYIKSYIRGILQ